MTSHKIVFDNIEWTDAGPGARYKSFAHGGQRLRLVEFSDGFTDPDWCVRGHAGIVLSGSFTLNYSGSLERCGKGDVIFISGGAADRHRAVLGAGETVTLLLFEVLEN